METLLLDADAVDANSPMSAVVSAVESSFAAHARGDVQMPAKSYVDLPRYDGDFRSMPAYLDVRDPAGDSADRGTSGSGDEGGWDAAGVKWVNVHARNRERFGLPTVMGVLVYSDPETAYPLAIMDGTTLTRKRTGAAAAVATDYLAVEDADSLGIVGAGVQSYAQLEAIAEVRDIERVVVHDRSPEAVEAFVEAFGDRFDVRGGSASEAGHCDVLSTVTPVESPIVAAEDVGERTHVNAMGADAAGKHELADELLLAAKLVVDDYEQATHSGEINVPYSRGILTDDDIHAVVGEVIVGRAAGRTPDDGVTVFDSTGLAIQDVATARVVYRHAEKHGDGTRFDLLGV